MGAYLARRIRHRTRPAAIVAMTSKAAAENEFKSSSAISTCTIQPTIPKSKHRHLNLNIQTNRVLSTVAIANAHQAD